MSDTEQIIDVAPYREALAKARAELEVAKLKVEAANLRRADAADEQWRICRVIATLSELLDEECPAGVRECLNAVNSKPQRRKKT